MMIEDSTTEPGRMEGTQAATGLFPPSSLRGPVRAQRPEAISRRPGGLRVLAAVETCLTSNYGEFAMIETRVEDRLPGHAVVSVRGSGSATYAARRATRSLLRSFSACHRSYRTC